MGSKRLAGRYGPARESWVQLMGDEYVLYEYNGDDDDSDGDRGSDRSDSDLPRIVVAISSRGGRSTRVTLTNMTVNELEHLQRFIDRAIEKAKPICAEIDRRAEQAWEAGDDSYPRLYRPIPELHLRARREPEHDAVVQDRPDDADGGSREQPE